jgi:26S proteasome regulatory subunit N3
VLSNNILRNYLHFNLFDQADKFRRNSTFPEAKSTTQHARYLYYIGRIAALHLHYSDAYTHLTAVCSSLIISQFPLTLHLFVYDGVFEQALRKAPQRKALGFRQRANKLLVIVQLLMGDIPDR